MWPLSWCWPLKMTDCQSSRCGTSVLPHHPLKSLRTTQGEALTGCRSGSILFTSCFADYTVCTFCLCFLTGGFCPYPGARLTLSSCWVVLKTTGSSAGIQILERYTTLRPHLDQIRRRNKSPQGCASACVFVLNSRHCHRCLCRLITACLLSQIIGQKPKETSSCHCFAAQTTSQTFTF